MREFNYNCFEPQVKLIRLKSDNYDCYVTPKVYHDIQLSMSSGDYGAHKAVVVYVNTNRLYDIELIQDVTFSDGVDDLIEGYWFYDGFGNPPIFGEYL